MERFRHVLRIAALVHVGLGPVLVVIIVLSSPWEIGVGRIEEALRHLETIDWRWLTITVIVLAWGLPIVAVAAWLRARHAGLETEKIRRRIEGLLGDRQIPIVVDVNTRIPVKVTEPLTIPIEVATRLAIDEMVDIETSVPLRLDLPLDTVIETSVFGIGTVKVPIRARIPVDLVVPIAGKIRIKADALPVHIKDHCVARLPEFEVPIQTRIETKLALLDNLRAAEKELLKK